MARHARKGNNAEKGREGVRQRGVAWDMLPQGRKDGGRGRKGEEEVRGRS